MNSKQSKKQAFNARGRVARVIARLARQGMDYWVYDQAREWARSGRVGADLQGWIDWYWGRIEETPQATLGSYVDAVSHGWKN